MRRWAQCRRTGSARNGEVVARRNLRCTPTRRTLQCRRCNGRVAMQALQCRRCNGRVQRPRCTSATAQRCTSCVATVRWPHRNRATAQPCIGCVETARHRNGPLCIGAAVRPGRVGAGRAWSHDSAGASHTRVSDGCASATRHSPSSAASAKANAQPAVGPNAKQQRASAEQVVGVVRAPVAHAGSRVSGRRSCRVHPARSPAPTAPTGLRACVCVCVRACVCVRVWVATPRRQQRTTARWRYAHSTQIRAARTR